MVFSLASLLGGFATSEAWLLTARAITGVEAEAELPFAALHALMRPALDEIGALPGRQAEALRGAFGMTEAAVADRSLAGLAVLSLVAELAEDRPVLCLCG